MSKPRTPGMRWMLIDGVLMQLVWEHSFERGFVFWQARIPTSARGWVMISQGRTEAAVFHTPETQRWIEERAAERLADHVRHATEDQA